MKSRVEIKANAREALRARRGMSIGLVLAPMLVAVLIVAVFFVLMWPAIGAVLPDGGVAYASGSIALESNPAAMIPSILMLLAMLSVWLLMPALSVTIDGGYTQIYRNDDVTVGSVFRRLFQRWGRKIWVVFLVAWFTSLWGILFELPSTVLTAITNGMAIQSEFGLYLLNGLLIIVSVVMSVALSIFIMRYMMASYLIAEYPNITARKALRLSIVMTEGYRAELFIAELSFIGWMLLSALTLMILGLVYAIPYMQTTMAGYYVELRDQALTSGIVSAYDLGDSSYVS